MKLALTDITLRKLQPPESGQTRIFDTNLPGFGVQVGKRSKTFFVIRGERRKLTTIGRYPQIALKTAREERSLYPREVSRLVRKGRGGAIRQYPHSMMICDTLASIEIGLRGTDCELVTWSEILERHGTIDKENPFKLPCDITYTYPKTGKRHVAKTFLVPDAVFGIRRDKKVSFFALEAERGNGIWRSNLHQPSFLKKILGYQSWRPLTNAERKVNFSRIEKMMDSLEGKLSASILAMMRKEAETFLKRLSQAVLKDDTKAIKKAHVTFQAKYAALLKGGMRDAYDFGKNNAAREIGVPPPPRNQQTLRNIDVMAATVASRHAEEVTAIAKGIPQPHICWRALLRALSP